MGRNNPNEESVPHMGEIVINLLDEHEMNQAVLAKKLGWKEPAVTKLLKKRNWNMFELQEVGKAIGEDLFDLCKPAPAEPMLPASQVAEGLEREAKLEEKIRKLEEDLKIMKAKYDTALEFNEGRRK